MTATTLSIVIPAFNEQESIGAALQASSRCGTQMLAEGVLSGFAVIVVDDGSTDRTASVVQRHAEANSGVTLCRHEANRGLGAALRTALGRVDTDFAFYTDADLPVDLGVVPRAMEVAELARADIVSLYRNSRRGEGPRRFAYSLGYNAILRVVLGLRARDVNFAAKLLRMSAMNSIPLRSEGSFIDAEILARVQHLDGHIEQFGADYRPRSRGVSTLSSASTIRLMLSELADQRSSILNRESRLPELR